MRFNDEVQFTVALCRAPTSVVLPESIPTHCSISIDYMTQGDTVCLSPILRAAFDVQQLKASDPDRYWTYWLAKAQERDRQITVHLDSDVGASKKSALHEALDIRVVKVPTPELALHAMLAAAKKGCTATYWERLPQQVQHGVLPSRQNYTKGA